MKKQPLIIIGIAVAVLLLILVPACSSYNGMVTLDEAAEQSWAEVENQYQRRHDLIPNLVNTVKGYAEHESTTLQISQKITTFFLILCSELHTLC